MKPADIETNYLDSQKWCCELGLTHLEMVSREYHIPANSVFFWIIWQWYVFLNHDKLFNDQFMHHLWIMVLEIQ